MTYYMQTVILIFIEALCCKIFFDTFLAKKFFQRRWISKIFFGVLLTGFIGISFLSAENPIVKAMFAIILISIIVYIQYRIGSVQTLFLSIVYYGLLISIDMIMLTVIQFTFDSRVKEIFNDPIKITILALMCKTILFLVIIFLNKVFKPYGSFNLITDKEWIRFLFFPIITIVCMFAFAFEGRESSKAVLVVSFALVLSNFLVFYIIGDIVEREKDIQEIRLSQERTKNQMDMYRQVESVYSEQRKKTHEFKNYLGCLHGLLATKKYLEAEKYVEGINHNWIEEIDYINTNNAIINSVLNQKFKQAKKKGIPMILAINDLGNIMVKDEDMVTLLANLLDNAIEAYEKVTKGSKLIKLRFLDEEGKITISVRNPVAEPVKIVNNEILTTKDDKNQHGIGLTNIQNVVNKYCGECIYSYNEGYFTHSILIYHKTN